jgi:hypothetical protein
MCPHVDYVAHVNLLCSDKNQAEIIQQKRKLSNRHPFSTHSNSCEPVQDHCYHRKSSERNLLVYENVYQQ